MRRGARSAAVVSVAALGAGCGGEGERREAGEAAGTYRAELLEASFPKRQRLGHAVTLRLTVRNAGDRAIPNLAVTVDGLARDSEAPALATSSQAVWIVDDPARGGVTAYVSTVAAGRVPAGTERTLRWRVTPVRAGTHVVRLRLAASLQGGTELRLAGRPRPEGTLTVRVAEAPHDGERRERRASPR